VRDQVVDDAFIQAMKQSKVWYVPTFTVDESFFVYEGRPAFMQTAFFQQAAGPKLMAKFNAPGYAEKINQEAQTAQHRKDFAVGQQNLKKLDKAITVLRGLSSGNSTSAQNGKRRTLSVAARRKIAKAQRLRWAKVRQQRASKS